MSFDRPRRAATGPPAGTTRRVRTGLLLGAAGLAGGWIWYRNAWITDDPFITFRTVEQLLAGHGLPLSGHALAAVGPLPPWGPEPGPGG